METANLAIVKYFSHNKCNVCKVLFPKIEQLLKDQFPKVQLQYINIEHEPEISANHQVFAAPTILIFFEGKEYYRFTRNMSISQLEEAIKRPYNLLF